MGKHDKHLKKQLGEFKKFFAAYLLTALIVILAFALDDALAKKEERDNEIDFDRDYSYSYHSSSSRSYPSYTYTTTARQTTTAPRTASRSASRRSSYYSDDSSEVDILDEDYLEARSYGDFDDFYDDVGDEFDDEDDALDYWLEMTE